MSPGPDPTITISGTGGYRASERAHGRGVAA